MLSLENYVWITKAFPIKIPTAFLTEKKNSKINMEPQKITNSQKKS